MTLLEEFEATNARCPAAAARQVYGWLCDWPQREALYAELRQARRPLSLQGRPQADPSDASGRLRPAELVHLLADPEQIAAALQDSETFSNAPYRNLGSGSFMLGLDGFEHHEQRAFAAACLELAPQQIEGLVRLAFAAGALHVLKQPRFDAAVLAEQVALRFGGFLFGFENSDHPLLEQALGKAYVDLNYLILGRHFVTDPKIPAEARAVLALLLARTAALVDLYQQPIGAKQAEEQQALAHEHAELVARVGPWDPVLQQLARADGAYSNTDRAVVALGLLAGTIGNVQASVCTVLEYLFEDPARLSLAQEQAVSGSKEQQVELEATVMKALARRPPAAFLPRQLLRSWTVTPVIGAPITLPKGAQLLLCMGGATAARPDLVFGGLNRTHDCVGRHLAQPLVLRCVIELLSLDGLVQQLDPLSGRPKGLSRQWGFKCESYPLRYERSRSFRQQPLNVVMAVKQPQQANAEALRKVIRYGAPRIEAVLKASRHVHFAWFTLIENDSKLALHTCFDGDFEAYIEHFALRVGPLFDRIFQYIEGAPPTPVDRYPKEFVEVIRRYNVAPVEGYFFSAYPAKTVSSLAGPI